MTTRLYGSPTDEGFDPRSKPLRRGTTLLEAIPDGAIQPKQIVPETKVPFEAPSLALVARGWFLNPAAPLGTSARILNNVSELARALPPLSRTGMDLVMDGYSLDMFAHADAVRRRDGQQLLLPLIAKLKSFGFVKTTYTQDVLMDDSRRIIDQFDFAEDARRAHAIPQSVVGALPRSALNALRPSQLLGPLRAQHNIEVLISQRARAPYQLAPFVPANQSIAVVSDGRMRMPAVFADTKLNNLVRNYARGQLSHGAFTDLVYARLGEIRDATQYAFGMALFPLDLLDDKQACNRMLDFLKERQVAAGSSTLVARGVSAFADDIRTVANSLPSDLHVDLEQGDFRSYFSEDSHDERLTKFLRVGYGQSRSTNLLACIAADRGFDRARQFVANPDLCVSAGARLEDAKRQVKIYEFLMDTLESNGDVFDQISVLRSRFARTQFSFLDTIAARYA